jgi:hypothetical protein
MTPRSRARLHGRACVAGFHRLLPWLAGGRLAVNCTGRSLEACRGTGLARPGYGRQAPNYVSSISSMTLPPSCRWMSSMPLRLSAAPGPVASSGHSSSATAAGLGGCA